MKSLRFNIKVSDKNGELLAKCTKKSERSAKLMVIEYVYDYYLREHCEIVISAGGDYVVIVGIEGHGGSVVTRYWALSVPPPRWSYILSSTFSAEEKAEEKAVRQPRQVVRRKPEEFDYYELGRQEWRGKRGEILDHPVETRGMPVIWLQGGPHLFFHTVQRRPRKNSRIRCECELHFGDKVVIMTKYFLHSMSAMSFLRSWRKNVAKAEFFEMNTNQLIFKFNPSTLRVEYTPAWKQFPELSQYFCVKKKKNS